MLRVKCVTIGLEYQITRTIAHIYITIYLSHKLLLCANIIHQHDPFNNMIHESCETN